MSVHLSYDPQKATQLMRMLDEATRLKYLKSAFRKAGNVVRKIAQQNLQATGLHNSGALAKGIRTGVSKNYVGFFVTTRTKKAGRRGFHKNRYGKEKPVLMWAEKGTKDRQTRGKKSLFGLVTKEKKKHRGRMRAYGFLKKTSEDAKGQVTDIVHGKLLDTLKAIAKKTGCDVT